MVRIHGEQQELAPVVYGLRSEIFTLRYRVRVPVGVPGSVSADSVGAAREVRSRIAEISYAVLAHW